MVEWPPYLSRQESTDLNNLVVLKLIIPICCIPSTKSAGGMPRSKAQGCLAESLIPMLWNS